MEHLPVNRGRSQTRLIRLRNETIPPRREIKGSLFARGRAEQNPVASGLFLIQFTGPALPEWREQLKAAGVDLLRYVPDDAFVARLKSVRVETLRTMRFIRWAGDYRAEHKIHHDLTAGRHTAERAAAAPLEVAILLAPRAAAHEIAAARATLLKLKSEANYRSGGVLRGTIPADRLDTLALNPAVLWIEPAHDMKLFDEVSSKLVAGDDAPGVTATMALGFDGSGVKVAVADSGLDSGQASDMHPDLFGRATDFLWYGSLTDAADEHSHGTHCAGIIAGNGATGEVDDNGALYGLGVAPGARIVAQRIFDGAGGYEPPPTFETLTRDATSAGAVIGSNSWGDDTQGRYDISAMEFDALVRDANGLAGGDQPYILEFSAGNAGPGSQTVGSPAVAKNVIATGASQNDRLDLFIYDDGPDAMADFSSRGPCEDGRIKPDVCAPGTWIASLRSVYADDNNAWAPISANYLYQGGTSQAGPHVSGAAAVFVQFYRQTVTNQTPSPALVKAALINCAVDMEDDFGTTATPNMDEGWGRVDLTEIIGSPRRNDFVDQSVRLTTSQTFEHSVIVASSDEPLKITLAYTDEPGLPAAIPSLVNDLDLEVIGPDGAEYHGNQFFAGESIPNAPDFDSINNVEGVHLAGPLPGEYRVRVQARNVPGSLDQDFALVTSGDLVPAGAAVMLTDRRAYRAPAVIGLKVIDADLAGNATVSAFIKSTTEANEFGVTLTASGPTGTFTGAVATATGALSAGAPLQIAHNDTITVRYFDTSAGSNRFATARGDLVPPALSGVTATNEFGQTLIRWNSDEPANSVVRFNTNATLSHAVTNLTLTTAHEVALTGLIAGRTNFFHVASTDEAGNTMTNDNNGPLFKFVAAPAHTLLIVDAFVSNGFDNDMPLSDYTNTLAQIGVSYDVWYPATRGRTPGTNDLRPYRAVIWRFNDGVFSADTLSSADQNAIRLYLREGGAFFMAAMEQLTRVGNGFFRNQVLHVADFAEDAGVPDLIGTPGDSLSAGMNMVLDYEQYDNLWHEALMVPDDISDTFTPTADAAPIVLDSGGAIAGLKYPRTGQDGLGRVVYLAFPLDAVPTSGDAPDNRATLMQNIMTFLVPGANGRGTIALDAPAYTLPGVASVEVGDSDLAGQTNIVVTFYSTTQTNGVAITLVPTVTEGLFRGGIELVLATNPPAAGRLRAQNGDAVWADYFDASANAFVRAMAVIDTVKPAITNVAAVADYESAVITWTTSEPADSQVQFGGSTFLDRSAQDAVPTTDHEVTLRGLLPDNDYFFKVLSRDTAGNLTEADDGGQLFLFHTRAPKVPPWFDNMNTGGTNWSVESTDESQTVWTLGVPDNGRATNAHSPPAAWGSNLTGQPLDYTETFLISPALDLTSGSSATLKFWHNYDFTPRSEFDILESGQLFLVINSSATPILLEEFGDESADWEEAEYDLTPYIGRVVYLAWFHQLLSFDTLPRPGWLVDDVSVTLSNTATGTIIITNNIWQAQFSLTGPTNRSGQGVWTTLSNVPPGQYGVQFSDVAYRQTPPAQNKTLAAGGTIQFDGNYTFTDANSNGISDAWEQYFFGVVSTNRTPLTDTDGDGLTDLEEFNAGTDPNSPPPGFRVTVTPLPGGSLRFDWPTAPGHNYRVDSATSFTTWSPVSSWLLAAGLTTNYTLVPPADNVPRFYRVEATATAVAAADSPPPGLRVNTSFASNNMIRVEWNSVANRGYRVDYRTNNSAPWSPYTDWILAGAAPSSLLVPIPNHPGPTFFRIEVQP